MHTLPLPETGDAIKLMPGAEHVPVPKYRPERVTVPVYGVLVPLPLPLPPPPPPPPPPAVERRYMVEPAPTPPPDLYFELQSVIPAFITEMSFNV